MGANKSPGCLVILIYATSACAALAASPITKTMAIPYFTVMGFLTDRLFLLTATPGHMFSLDRNVCQSKSTAPADELPWNTRRHCPENGYDRPHP